MRLVYLDEAGTGNDDEPVTMAGIIVHGDQQLNDARKHLGKILKKHIPEGKRDGFVFHAAHIFNGGGPLFGRNNPEWPLEKRLAIADDLAAIPTDLKLRIAFGWHFRGNFMQHDQETRKQFSKHQITLGCLALSYISCAALVDQWMRKHARNENCLMIMEDNPPARKLILETQNFNQNPKLVSQLEPRAMKLFPFKHIREDVLFQPKKQSSVLEVADFCAYVWKRFLMDQKDTRYLRFFNPMRSQIVTYPSGPVS